MPSALEHVLTKPYRKLKRETPSRFTRKLSKIGLTVVSTAARRVEVNARTRFAVTARYHTKQLSTLSVLFGFIYSSKDMIN